METKATGKVRYFISMKTMYGNYRTFEKEFNDEKHFENWYGYMNRKGHKIIGVEDVPEVNFMGKSTNY